MDDHSEAELTRRWSEALTHTRGVDLERDEAERMIGQIVAEAREDLRTAHTAAVERFARIYAHAPVGIALTDESGTIAEANAALATVLGDSPEQLRGQCLPDLVTTADGAQLLREHLADVQHGGEPRQLHVDFRHSTDEEHRTVVTLTTLPADTTDREYPVAMVQDVNQEHSLGERLLHQNVHDPLTGLPNAGSFENHLEAWLADPSRSRIALVFFDLDGFRVINDGLGSEVGDALLRAVAGKLTDTFSTPDTFVARLTGDGFGVLVRGELTTNEVIEQVSGALNELSEPIYIGGEAVGVNASAGIVVQGTGEGQARDLKRKGETTLHRAKERGRAQWVLFEHDADAADRDRYRMAASLAGALENGEFELVYQPTVKLDGSGALPVVNAMLQWDHPEWGRLPSEEFLPMADATGMTLPIGRWMLTEALSTHARWRESIGDDGTVPDLCLRLPTRLAIDHDLVGMVKRDLENTGVPPQSLRLCAAADTVRDPRGEVLDSLGVLRELGAQLVLEVSSVADLEVIHRHSLPVSYVVLVGSIIEGLGRRTDDEPRSAVRHIDHLLATAAELGVRAGAEGVRTAEQARKLGELGVIAARGPFYLESASAERIETLLTGSASEVARTGGW
ncbi:EAL domain-containing protein [Haloechinothrix aidingensis]